MKSKFSKKANRGLVFNAQNQELPLLKTRKSIRVNKKKLSSEDSNTKQNKSTNTTSDNISDD